MLASGGKYVRVRVTVGTCYTPVLVHRPDSWTMWSGSEFACSSIRYKSSKNVDGVMLWAPWKLTLSSLVPFSMRSFRSLRSGLSSSIYSCRDHALLLRLAGPIGWSSGSESSSKRTTRWALQVLSMFKGWRNCDIIRNPVKDQSRPSPPYWREGKFATSWTKEEKDVADWCEPSLRYYVILNLYLVNLQT